MKHRHTKGIEFDINLNEILLTKDHIREMKLYYCAFSQHNNKIFLWFCKFLILENCNRLDVYKHKVLYVTGVLSHYVDVGVSPTRMTTLMFCKRSFITRWAFTTLRAVTNPRVWQAHLSGLPGQDPNCPSLDLGPEKYLQKYTLKITGFKNYVKPTN